MLGFDIEKVMHAVTQPFHEVLDDFGSKMPEMIEKLEEQNELLRQILTVLKEEKL